MTKKQIALLPFIFLSFLGFSQHALFDANKIYSRGYYQDGEIKVDSSNREEMVSILQHYLLDDSDDINKKTTLSKLKTTLSKSFESNPFIQAQTTIQNDGEADKALGFNPVKEYSSFVSNLDVTNIAIGLTDFLIKRAKSELNIAFFKRFKKEIEDPDYADLQLLFPNTYRLLKAIDNNIYQYDLYLNNLRHTFQRDFEAIYENLPNVLKNHRGDIEKLGKGYYHLAQLSVKGAKWNDKGYHGGELLRLITEEQQFIKMEEEFENNAASEIEPWVVTNGIWTVTMISESLRDTGENRYWLGEEDIKRLKNDKVLKLYLGLMYQLAQKEPYKNIKFPGDISIQAMLDDVANKWETGEKTYIELRDFIMKIVNRVKSVEASYLNLNRTRLRLDTMVDLAKREKRKLLFDAHYQAYVDLIGLAKQALVVNSLPGLDAKLDLDKAEAILNYMEIGGSISAGIAYKEYAAALSQATILLNTVLVKADNVDETIGKVLKYGSFMAALIDAKDPEEVEAVIEAAALPPGSYSVKRVSRFNVALNGYAGGFFGNEEIDNDGGSDGINNVALTIPVGISMSFGNVCKKWDNPFSIGLSMPLVDLGTIASYRLDGKDDMVEDVPSVRLKHIFSPGAFLEVGIAGTPLTFGFGAQIGPRLRKIEEGADANQIGDTYLRYGLSLKVDIPLMNFYTSPGGK